MLRSSCPRFGAPPERVPRQALSEALRLRRYKKSLLQICDLYVPELWNSPVALLEHIHYDVRWFDVYQRC